MGRSPDCRPQGPIAPTPVLSPPEGSGLAGGDGLNVPQRDGRLNAPAQSTLAGPTSQSNQHSNSAPVAQRTRSGKPFLRGHRPPRTPDTRADSAVSNVSFLGDCDKASADRARFCSRRAISERVRRRLRQAYPGSRVSPRADRRQGAPVAEARGLLERDEAELLRTFMAFAGRAGSHAGLSGAADSQLRRHFATALLVFAVAKLG